MKPTLLIALFLTSSFSAQPKTKQHLLYVANPGTRNYTEYGGVGISVFDIDNHYKFVKRIPTWETEEGKKPENVKGIVASAVTGRVYVSELSRMMAIDAVTGKKIWDKAYDGGCDRMAISPDGQTLYLPQLEGPAWYLVDANTGDIKGKVQLNSGSHNTIASADGKNVYLAGLKSSSLPVFDTASQKVAMTVGPFGNVIRPLTVNGSGTLVFVNVNGLLGFEVGDLKTGKFLHRVEVTGYKPGTVKRHGCPSHGIALSPDEKELWVADCANSAIHIFDTTVMPPVQRQSIAARDCVGWLSFSMDGRYAYSSTGEIFDAATKKLVAALKDEAGHDVQSEKMLDLEITDGKVTGAGSQFGVGKSGVTPLSRPL